MLGTAIILTAILILAVVFVIGFIFEIDWMVYVPLWIVGGGLFLTGWLVLGLVWVEVLAQ